MKVLVTGGTGFVGAHSVEALLAGGHQVRMLVRRPERIREALGPSADRIDSHVVGDMTDRKAVEEAVSGCDAVLHAAAVVTLSSDGVGQAMADNPAGAETVLGAAVDAGLDPIVFVSSAAALFRPGIDVLHSDLPPADVGPGYGRSKADAEGVARRLQDQGAPVCITYPGGVLGPPVAGNFGEAVTAVVAHLRMGLIITGTIIPVIDVRDLAAIHAATMEPGWGPRRFMCGGHRLEAGDLAAIYRPLTGRRFPVLPIPGLVVRQTGRVLGLAARVLPFEPALNEEAATITSMWPRTDDSRLAELGVRLRPARDTLSDTIVGLLEEGRVSKREAGLLASAVPG